MKDSSVAVIHFHLLAKGIIIFLPWVLIVLGFELDLHLAAGWLRWAAVLTYIHVHAPS